MLHQQTPYMAKHTLVVLCLLLTTIMILSFTDLHNTIPSVLRGQVVSGITGQPVARAYIVAVSGEEETLTDTDGHFTLRTWQRLPVTLTIQHSDYQTSQLVVADTVHAPLIQLRGK